MSLRNLVKNQWWWVVVLVLWAFEVLGIFYTLADFVLTIVVTLLVLIAKAVEYLTRPAQSARQAAQHTAKKDKVNELDRKNKNYGIILGIIIGFVLFGILAYVSIIFGVNIHFVIIYFIFGVNIYFIVFYVLEKYYERKNRLLYYTGYYALRVGVIMIIILILAFIFAISNVAVF